MLKDTLDSSERLDHIRSVVVKVPELPVVPLVRPPERVVPGLLELPEVLAYLAGWLHN